MAGCRADQLATSSVRSAPPPTSTPTALPSPTSRRQPSPTPEPFAPEPTSPPSSTVLLGIGVTKLDERGGLGQIVAAGAHWARRDSLMWSEFETERGLRDWARLEELEQELISASKQGLEVILIVHGTPGWAQLVPGSYCGPVHPDALEAFANFMHDLVERYSAPPFQVRHWELWNEPDVDPSHVAPRSVIGCWGDRDDPYYGGGYYAEMLKAVYPQMKAADPEAQVLVGGLLLDCDPRHPPEDRACEAARFLEGILLAEGDRYFDGVSFHAYDSYYGEPGRYGNSNWGSAWNTTGPVLLAKARYLSELMARYGAAGKTLLGTEVALLCGSSGREPACQADALEVSKAYYIAQVAAAAPSEGLRAVLWYSLDGWRASGLMDSQGEPLPAYFAYQYAASALRDAVPQGQITSFPGVDGYAHRRGAHLLWVLWSQDGELHQVALPSAPDAAYDVFGEPVQVGDLVQVTLSPLYLEWQE